LTSTTLHANGHPATTTVIAPPAAAAAASAPSSAAGPSHKRAPVLRIRARDRRTSGRQAWRQRWGTRSIVRPLGLSVCRLLAARVRPAAF